jgi:hypothetical protein
LVFKNEEKLHTHKLAKSMPTIVDCTGLVVRRDNHIYIEEGEGKVVGNKLYIILEKNKLGIKSIHEKGFFRYLSEYE